MYVIITCRRELSFLSRYTSYLKRRIAPYHMRVDKLYLTSYFRTSFEYAKYDIRLGLVCSPNLCYHPTMS